MRTTLNIDDRILAIAKHRAIEQGVTLTCVVENALRDAFSRMEEKNTKINLLTVKGQGVKPGIDLDLLLPYSILRMGFNDLFCMRYIEMNLVRAGIVDHPAKYRWSSYAANVFGTRNAILHQHDEYKGLGAAADLRQRAYQALFDFDSDSGAPGSIDNGSVIERRP